MSFKLPSRFPVSKAVDEALALPLQRLVFSEHSLDEVLLTQQPIRAPHPSRGPIRVTITCHGTWDGHHQARWSLQDQPPPSLDSFCHSLPQPEKIYTLKQFVDQTEAFV